ncbi:unnamed protein product [Strongylus vulgaris]|uniref:Uncharacterized protein n=1 Tax=Strongylus vulgaris TaxID=40348 RepID=A0A3P7JMN0_STRVU|nr:unnamed protein product [Strongylus vulgaris]
MRVGVLRSTKISVIPINIKFCIGVLRWDMADKKVEKSHFCHVASEQHPEAVALLTGKVIGLEEGQFLEDDF